jgi:hypothetical protein
LLDRTCSPVWSREWCAAMEQRSDPDVSLTLVVGRGTRAAMPSDQFGDRSCPSGVRVSATITLAGLMSRCTIAAGEADLGHALARERPGQARDLLERQKLAAWKEREVASEDFLGMQ